MRLRTKGGEGGGIAEAGGKGKNTGARGSKGEISQRAKARDISELCERRTGDSDMSQGI